MRRVIIHRADADETGYWAECPSLGCVSQGETIDETLANLREAIALWIESMQAHGEPIPEEDAAEIDPIMVAAL